MVFTYSNQGPRSALPKTSLLTLFLAWSEIHNNSMPTYVLEVQFLLIYYYIYSPRQPREGMLILYTS